LIDGGPDTSWITPALFLIVWFFLSVFAGVAGAGSYTHETLSGNGWGNLRVRVASRDPVVLQVDGTYTDQRPRSEIATAWVWRRQA